MTPFSHRLIYIFHIQFIPSTSSCFLVTRSHQPRSDDIIPILISVRIAMFSQLPSFRSQASSRESSQTTSWISQICFLEQCFLYALSALILSCPHLTQVVIMTTSPRVLSGSEGQVPQYERARANFVSQDAFVPVASLTTFLSLQSASCRSRFNILKGLIGHGA